MNDLYNANVHLNSDECWLNSKDTNNNQLEKYALYFNDNAKEDKSYGSLPNNTYEHVNLQGKPGYGVSDDYLIDTYSSLRNNKDAMTRDRCHIQLITRTFTAGPRLTGKERDINTELDVLSGSDTRSLPAIGSLRGDEHIKCNKQIMEQSMNNFLPMLDCIKEVQNPDNIVPTWTRGGDDTRSYINKVKFSKCNK